MENEKDILKKDLEGLTDQGSIEKFKEDAELSTVIFIVVDVSICNKYIYL
jgi:hypothetical protein